MQQEEDYKSEVDKLRDLKLKNKTRLFTGELNMDKLIQSMSPKERKKESIPLLTYESITIFPVNEWVVLDEKMNFCLTDASETKLIFLLILKPQAHMALIKFNTIHTLEVLEGSLKDLYTDKVYEKGDIVNYEQYEPHEFTSDIYTSYKITHYKVS